jgi:hypothetical protein
MCVKWVIFVGSGGVIYVRQRYVVGGGEDIQYGKINCMGRYTV